VLAGGLVFLIALLKNYAINPELAYLAIGLKVLLAFVGLALITVGVLSVSSSNNLKPENSHAPDEYELDQFYYLKPRAR